MTTIPRSTYTCRLSPEDKPAFSIAAGERVLVEVPSARGGVLDGRGESSAPSPQPNPFTGPISVAGIMPGDTIAVCIHEVRAVGFGMTVGTVYTPEGSRLFFGDGLSVPQQPSIGGIGVAPDTIEACTGNMDSGPHGGNYDCRDVAAGSVLFLKARLAGANLGLGDVHLAMGDGELEGAGVEAAADIELTVARARAVGIEWPWLIRDDEIMTLAGHADIGTAIHLAYEAMIDLCGELFSLVRDDVRVRIAPAGSVRICQSCCDIKTVRIALPLELLGTTAEDLKAQLFMLSRDQ